MEKTRKISEQVEEKSRNSDRPWISFEFFPPKTEVSITWDLLKYGLSLSLYKPACL